MWSAAKCKPLPQYVLDVQEILINVRQEQSSLIADPDIPNLGAYRCTPEVLHPRGIICHVPASVKSHACLGP